AYKIYALGYTMTTIEPEEGYFIRLMLDIRGNGGEANVEVTLPIQSERQTVLHEKQVSEQFRYSISPGRIGRWYARVLDGDQRIVYSFLAQTNEREYPLPVGRDIPTTYTRRLWDELAPTPRIQSNDPVIRAKSAELVSS